MVSVMEVQGWPSKFPNPLQQLLVNYNNLHSNILCKCSCYAPCRVRSSVQKPHLNIIMVKCTFKISLFLLSSMFLFSGLIVPLILNFGITPNSTAWYLQNWQQRYILLRNSVQKVYLMQYINPQLIWYSHIPPAIVFLHLFTLPVNLSALSYLMSQVVFIKHTVTFCI